MAEDTGTISRKNDSASPFQPGDTLIGRFELKELLSEEGHLSWVYRATDTYSPGPEKRSFMVKIPRFDQLDEFPALDDLLVREGENRMRLVELEVNHRHLLIYKDVYKLTHPGRKGEIPFVVAEYLEGRTLSRTLAETGPLPAGMAFEIAEQVLEGLSELHRVGVVHRDLKPANIMLLKQEPLRVKIIDLGIAADLARDQGERAKGWYSPTYAADELIYKNPPHPPDATTDLFSFGVLLYELFGGVPYDCRAERPRLGGKEHLPQGLDRLVRECCHDRFASVPSPRNEATLKALEMLREARRTFERLKETGAQDTDDRSALRTQLLKLKGKYEGWLDVHVPLDKRLLCLQQMEDVLSRLRQADPDVGAWRASLDEEAGARQAHARECYETLLSDQDWEGLDRWEEGEAEALGEDERRTLVAQKNKAKEQKTARERYQVLLEARDWEALERWKQEEGTVLEEGERRRLLDEARLDQAKELAQAGDSAKAKLLFNMLVTEGATLDLRKEALGGLNALSSSVKAQPQSAAPAGCLLACSSAPRSALFVRPWPKTLYLGRGSQLNRASADPSQEGHWSHITLMCDESAVSAEVREMNRAISRRHLALSWHGNEWWFTNGSGFMAVRLGDRQVAAGESGSLARLPETLEFLKARILTGPWETVLALAVTTIGEGSEETPPSLLLESRGEEIAPGLRWLLVGAPVPGEAAFPGAFGNHTSPFQLSCREGRVFVEAREVGSENGHPLAKGAAVPMVPGETVAWGDMALEFQPVPEFHQAFLEEGE